MYRAGGYACGSAVLGVAKVLPLALSVLWLLLAARKGWSTWLLAWLVGQGARERLTHLGVEMVTLCGGCWHDPFIGYTWRVWQSVLSATLFALPG